MIRKAIFWLAGIPVAGVLIGLSVANRHVVTFSLDPTTSAKPFMAFDIPLYLLLFATMFAGLLSGWVVTWAGQHKWRRRAREKDYETAVLRREADELKRKASPFSGGPALPHF